MGVEIEGIQMNIKNICWSLMVVGVVVVLMLISVYVVWIFNQINVIGLIGSVGDLILLFSGVYVINMFGVVSGNWVLLFLVWYSGNGQGMSLDGSNMFNYVIDNINNIEVVLLNFSVSIVLISIGLGYIFNGKCKNNIIGVIMMLVNDVSCLSGMMLL